MPKTAGKQGISQKQKEKHIILKKIPDDMPMKFFKRAGKSTAYKQKSGKTRGIKK